MRIVLGSAAFCLAIVFGLLIRAAQQASDAEHTLHAYELVLHTLAARFSDPAAEWPTSWEDLRRTRCSHAPSMYSWPEDYEVVHERVQIDFDLTREDVAKMTVENFSAVTQREPHFGRREHAIEMLLNAARGISVPRN